MLTYEQLKQHVKDAGIKRAWDYHYAAKEHNWPNEPEREYRGEWKGWKHFLGEYDHLLSFIDLRNAVRTMGITSFYRYKHEQQQHADWPLNPDRVYPEDWVSWPSFFGIREEAFFKKRINDTQEHPAISAAIDKTSHRSVNYHWRSYSRTSLRCI